MSYSPLRIEDSKTKGVDAAFELSSECDGSSMTSSTGRVIPPQELKKSGTKETKEISFNMNDSTSSSNQPPDTETKENKVDSLENFFLALIIINSIMIGIGTFDFVTENETTSAVFFYFDLAFLAIFTVELAINLFRERYDAFKNKWIVFDFLIITLSWILSAVGKFDSSHEGSNEVQVLRSLRIMRLLPRIKSCNDVMGAIARSLAKLTFLLVFLSIIMFIFAIFFTEQYRDMFRDGQTDWDYFSRLDFTLLTLLQLLTFDNWSEVLRDVMEFDPLSWIPFLIFVVITGFVVINLAIAIICEPIFELKAAGEKKITKMEREIEQLENLMQSMCCDICDELDLPKPLLATNPEFRSTIALSSRSKNSNQSSENDISALNICKTVCNSGILSWKSLKRLCGIINDPYVQNFLIVTVILNCILIGIGTFDFVHENDSIYSAFEIVDTIFLSIYTLENIMLLIHHGPKMFKDPWLTFDFILIVVCWSLKLSPAFRVFRIIRVVRTFPKFEGMRVITETLYKSVPKIATITGILLAWFYIFAVMYTALFKDIPVGSEDGLSADYFSRLDKTLLTLFQFMTYSDWAEISRELSMHISWAPVLSSIFVTISELLFVNAIIALICESHEEIKNKQREDRSIRNAIKRSRKTPDERLEDLMEIKSDLLDMIKTSRTPEPKGANGLKSPRRSSSIAF